jgi:hypothetical protein
VSDYLGKKKLVRIYIDTEDKYDSKPLYEEILLRAKKCRMKGATVFKGIAGIGGHSEIHSFELLSLSQNLPVVIEMIDDEPKLREFLEVISSLITDGMCVMMDIDVLLYKHK